MIRIENLYAGIEGKNIINGLDLVINEGETHAIMGPNGSGKSTLSKVIAGHPDYEITQGNIYFQDKSILELSVDERAVLGLFLAFQYPLEIPGVSNVHFLKAALNTIRKAQNKDNLDAIDFLELVRHKIETVSMSEDLLYRNVNEGFSGGEKKRNEILQMLMLEPKFAILDETDSGLDIDALQTVANGVNTLRDEKRSFLVITHYQRLLDYIKPDFVHVLAKGKIIRSGGPELALELEQKGYGWLKEIAQ